MYRILHGAFALIPCFYIPQLSELGRPGEPLLMAGFVFFGEFFGVTVELSLRHSYAHKEAARKRESIVQAASAEAAGRVTEEVAGYVFHELRNDTNAAVGVFECIIEGVENGTVALPPELRQMVYLSRVHARHAMQVISNILDYSKQKRESLSFRSRPSS